MPLEDVLLTVRIGTHTDSLPLNGLKLAQSIAKAVAQYASEQHQQIEIVECESVMVDGVEWLHEDDCAAMRCVDCEPPCECTCKR